jgi:hypothetical protein
MTWQQNMNQMQARLKEPPQSTRALSRVRIKGVKASNRCAPKKNGSIRYWATKLLDAKDAKERGAVLQEEQRRTRFETTSITTRRKKGE